MTITYSFEVGESRYATFIKLLFRWRGSIYQLVFKELLTFCFLYYFLAIIYRCILDDSKKQSFEALVTYCREFTNMIPLTFILGFYVSLVVNRWWSVFMNLPWPDRTCLLVASLVQGADERGRQLRRTMARYLNAGALITLQAVSSVIKKRFPTERHMLDAGIMTESEWNCYQMTECNQKKWFLPFVWFNNLAMQAKKEGRIQDDILFKALIDEMLAFRSCCGMLLSYDWVNVPLVYTQVVTLAVYSYFVACLMGSQYISVIASESTTKTFDLTSSNDTMTSYNNHVTDTYDWSLTKYVPCFTLIQFFFYTGWLKVAEVLINPLGSDDEDFELNWLVDRNLEISYLLVDKLYGQYPVLSRDIHWDELQFDLPHTAASIQHKVEPFMGSTANFNVPKDEQGWVARKPSVAPSLSPIGEEDECGTPVATRKMSRLISFRPFQTMKRLISRSPSSVSVNSKISRNLSNGSVSVEIPQVVSPQLSRKRTGLFRSKSAQPKLAPVHLLSVGSLVDSELDNIVLGLQNDSIGSTNDDNAIGYPGDVTTSARNETTTDSDQIGIQPGHISRVPPAHLPVRKTALRTVRESSNE